MKELIKSKKKITLLPILGLVLLILLSPCKVRNFIQFELGVPQTEVSNKSKTTYNNSDCDHLDTTVIALAKEKNATQPLPYSNFVSTFNSKRLEFSSNHSKVDFNSIESAIQVPLYILYLNFKDYL